MVSARQLLPAITLVMTAMGVSASAAAGTGKTAVLGFGQCGEPVLIDASRRMRQNVASRLGDQVLSEEATAALAGDTARSSIEEVKRIIEAGKSDYMNLNMNAAKKRLEDILPEIDKQPLGSERWKAYWRAHAYLSRIHQHENENEEAEEYLKMILVVDPDFKLGDIEFPPSSRRLLDATRSKLAKQPHYRLSVKSKASGAPVYLNGFMSGKTPFQKELVAGTYQVVVGDGNLHSFVRRIDLSGPTALEAVDVEREAAFKGAHGACYTAGPEREQRLFSVALLAGTLAVDRVVVVRVERMAQEEYVAAALYDVNSGREVREGRVHVFKEGLPPLDRLAQFVLTGEETPEVQTVTKSPTNQPAPPEAVSGNSSASDSSSPSAFSRWWNSDRRWQRNSAIGLAGLAVALGTLAIIEQVRVNNIERDMRNLESPGSGGINSTNQAQYMKLKDDLNSASGIRTGSAIGAGLLAIGSGTCFWLSLGPSSPAPVASSHGFPGFSLAVGSRF